MKKLDKISDILGLITKVLSCAALFGMMLLICVDVLLRRTINESIIGCVDIVMMIMGVLIFASFVITQHDREMIHATFLLAKLPGKSKYIVWCLGHVISTAVCIAMAAATFIHGFAMRATNASTSTIHIPTAPFYFLSGLLLIMLSAVLTIETVKTVMALWNGKYAEEMHSQWTA